MIWTRERADKEFSLFIRARDPKCVRCHARPSDDCSHYFEKGTSSCLVRFDPENADGLCRQCHGLWEGRKSGYVEYKIRMLGSKGLMELQRKAKGSYKMDKAIGDLMVLLGKGVTNR